MIGHRPKHRRRWWRRERRSSFDLYLDTVEAEIQARPWPTAAEIWDPREASTLTDLPCFRPEPGSLPALALPAARRLPYCPLDPRCVNRCQCAEPCEPARAAALSPEHQLQVLVFETKLDVARIRQIRLELAALGRSLLAAAA